MMIFPKTKSYCSRLYRRLACVALSGLCLLSGVMSSSLAAQWQAVTYQTLPAWQQDDLQAFLPALLQSCQVMRNEVTMQSLCQQAKSLRVHHGAALRHWIETQFTPYQWVTSEASTTSADQPGALLTGYYEPWLQGSRQQSARYKVPLYRRPPADLQSLSRAEIVQHNRLAGYELLWVEDEMDAFFLQIQGSGRVLLDDGSVQRVAFDGHNGAPYQSIGALLQAQGEISPEAMSMQSIRAWAVLNPEAVPALLMQNPRFVYFRLLPLPLTAAASVAADASRIPQGPVGALGVPLTVGRSLAADWSVWSAGLPVWIVSDEAVVLPQPSLGTTATEAAVLPPATRHEATSGTSNTAPASSRSMVGRLGLVQDKGAAIQGAARLDLFTGHGEQAGLLAGTLKAPVRVWLLLPNSSAPK